MKVSDFKKLIRESVQEILCENNQIESDVSNFETSINTKYSNVISRFMVFYNKSKRSLELSDIYIKPEFYGIGYGSKIMDELVKFADKQKLPIILIPESERGSNKKLISFYSKFGFIINKGRATDFGLSIPFATSMYRLPK